MQVMCWSDIGKAQPLKMASVLRFMERFKKGSMANVRGASEAQIAELVRPLARGRASLPTVYVDFLETMGEDSNGIRLVWGSSSASRLLADRMEGSEVRVDPNRYFKYGIGELEDVIRAGVVGRFCIDANPKRKATAPSFGELASASVRVVEFLGRLGFVLTELGASPAVVPMENVERGAVALLLCHNPGYWTDTHLAFYTRDEKYDKYLREIIADNRAMLRGVR